MATITFSKSNETNITNGSGDINESGLHWCLFDTDVIDLSSTTQILEQGSNLNISAGEGSLVVSSPAGSYLMGIQSPTTEQIGMFIVDAV